VSYKIIIIGGGPGGYVAAIRAAQLGAKVALVENHKIGGTCLNYGCIPTKAFFKSAELLEEAKHSNAYGLEIDGVRLNTSLLQDHRMTVVNDLTSGVEKLLIANGVDLIYGTASFISEDKISVTDKVGTSTEYMAEKYVIATGSKVFIPPVKGIENKHVVTSKELLEFEALPEKLVILGGGVIALEFASIFNAFGSEVTVVARSTILKTFDKDVVKRVSAYLKKKGIRIFTNTSVLEIKDGENGAAVVVEGKKGDEILNADLILSAMGRRPHHTGLNVETAGLKLKGHAIDVNDSFKTSNENVYAIGDVNGRYMLAHAASHQGVHVVEEILEYGTDYESDQSSSKEANEWNMSKMDIVPSCVFISPELAAVGVTEDKAVAEGLAVKVSKFPFSANGKAMTINHTEGFVKLVALESGRLIGAQILGAHASDLIHELTIAIANGLSVNDVTSTIHAHPTLSESVAEAAFGLMEGALHMAPVKKKRK
jgi:dihydrolipoamide dehydrogenase